MGFFLEGREVGVAGNANLFPIMSPADNTVVSVFQECTIDDVESAVNGCEAAFSGPNGWGQTSVKMRAGILRYSSIYCIPFLFSLFIFLVVSLAKLRQPYKNRKCWTCWRGLAFSPRNSIILSIPCQLFLSHSFSFSSL